MDYYSIEFKKILAEKMIFDAWQHLINMHKNLSTSEFCKKVLEESFCKLDNSHQTLRNNLNNKITEHSAEMGRIIEIKESDLSIESVKIYNLDVPVNFVIEKYIKDYFQYLRNTYDILAQYINSTLIAPECIDVDKVDFNKMYNSIKKNEDQFPNTIKYMSDIKESSMFKYITAFNNRIKHTGDVQNLISFSIFGDNKKANINKFSKYGEEFEEVEIMSILNDSFEFTDSSLKKVLDAVYTEIELRPNPKNRVHELFYTSQILKEDNCNYTAICYEDDREIDDLPEELGILLLKIEDNVIAYNCEYDDVLVRSSDENYKGHYVAQETIEENGLLKYRRYKLDTNDGMMAFIEHTNREYKAKSFIMSGKIISDYLF